MLTGYRALQLNLVAVESGLTDLRPHAIATEVAIPTFPTPLRDHYEFFVAAEECDRKEIST